MENKLEMKSTRVFIGLFVGSLLTLTVICCAMSAMM